MKTTKEISDIVLGLPGVEWGFIQQTESLGKVRVGREPGSDAWKHRIERKSEFRCFLSTNKGAKEETRGILSQIESRSAKVIAALTPKGSKP